VKVNNYAGDALLKNRDFKGYAAGALELLLKHAFEDMGAEAVHNYFEAERSAAVRAHLKAGFTIYQRENGIIRLLISREQYIK
jgi:RimJ/RimL family protein N-acetyltransferase